MKITSIAQHLGVHPAAGSATRADLGFPAPATEVWTREWGRAEDGVWAEREWWDTEP